MIRDQEMCMALIRTVMNELFYLEHTTNAHIITGNMRNRKVGCLLCSNLLCLDCLTVHLESLIELTLTIWVTVFVLVFLCHFSVLYFYTIACISTMYSTNITIFCMLSRTCPPSVPYCTVWLKLT